jgi:hypothetical protein
MERLQRRRMEREKYCGVVVFPEDSSVTVEKEKKTCIHKYSSKKMRYEWEAMTYGLGY